MSDPQFPQWLHYVSIVSLALGFLCAGVILFQVRRHPPHMKVMAWVWPLCALFGSVLWLWLYRQAEGGGRHAGHEAHSGGGHHAGNGHAGHHRHASDPTWLSVAKGASHCGAGCTLGDILAEWLAFAVPGIAVALGWHSLFAEKTFAVWILDYVLAFAIGIAFQYFAIVPMRKLSPGKGIAEAVKADFLSITSWQVGMYGVMALGQFAWFRPAYGSVAQVDGVEFWFLMQVSMLAGFVTAYPVNWWLVKAGVKEAM
ncbi:DUF4396 domain-containing protein [Novosphingobium profundi]|uniref:DUF4396 domain-containing protein n=1 Tax=Novosphingobium profundi TaxID=1774954 RepID=UPI001BD9BD1A|nr:DUF4396 domain-containing protein [Novosphingobium profundi]MBT0668448.1 DUF4396 domain-containing protein [Novosphingobium profundi]